MFDGNLPPGFPPGVPTRSTAISPVSRSVVIIAVLALLGAGLTIAFRTEPSEGFSIELAGP